MFFILVVCQILRRNSCVGLHPRSSPQLENIQFDRYALWLVWSFGQVLCIINTTEQYDNQSDEEKKADDQ